MTGAMRAWRKDSATPLPKPRSARCCPRPRVPIVNSRLQRCQQILDQVVSVLESGRKPDQPVTNAKFRALFRRQPLMGRGRRMRDQAFRVTEIIGDADESERIEKAEGAFLSAFDLKRTQRRTGTHLFANDVCL